MKKRAHERIPADLEVNFMCENSSYTGRVTNLSKNGMYIEAETPLPFRSKFEVFFPFNLKLGINIPNGDEVLEVRVKVRRLVKKDDYFNGMGVELTNISDEYLEFLSGINHYSYQNSR
jgi:hypothetical protein